MKICINVAMDSEYGLVNTQLENGGIKGHSISLIKSGIGKVNAASRITEAILADKPELVISTGVAGSMDRSVHTGDFVVAQTIKYHDVWCGEDGIIGEVQGLDKPYCAPAALVGKAVALGAKSGLIVSGDWFVDTAAKAAEIKKAFPDALAVDMESGALAQVCTIKGIPFVSLRLISDSDEIARDESYRNFWTTAGEESFRLLKSFLESL